MTQKYVILTVWQAHLTYPLIRPGFLRRRLSSMSSIERKAGGLVAKHKTPPFYAFHQLNAYDDPSTGDVIVDMSVYPDNSSIGLLYFDKFRAASTPISLFGCARRFRVYGITLPAGARGVHVRDAQVDFTIPASESMELPTVKPELYNKPYRHAYGMSTVGHAFVNRLITLDMANPNDPHKTWGARGSYTFGEPILVSRPGGKVEDNGVVLSVVLDMEKQRSMLVMLDAKDMTELARAEMQRPYSFGFHGFFSQVKTTL